MKYRSLELDIVVKDFYQEINIRTAVLVKEAAIQNGLTLLPGEMPATAAELAKKQTMEESLFTDMKAAGGCKHTNINSNIELQGIVSNTFPVQVTLGFSGSCSTGYFSTSPIFEYCPKCLGSGYRYSRRWKFGLSWQL